MRGRRPLTLKAAARVVKSLGLNRGEANRLYSFVENERRSEFASAPSPEPGRKNLDADTFHLIAEWHHFAILNLMNCEGFRWKAAYIAKRLGLSPAQADHSMKLLLRLGLVKKRGDRIECAHDFVLSPDGIPSAAVRAYHRRMLEKAAEAIELQSLEERDVTGLGFAVDPVHLGKIKKEISEFQDQLAAKYSKGKRREVYFLEMALFRLSQGDNNE
jgi:uncharacterized protein (TIGR02147 family)